MIDLLIDLKAAQEKLKALAERAKYSSAVASSYVGEAVTKISAAMQQIEQDTKQREGRPIEDANHVHSL